MRSEQWVHGDVITMKGVNVAYLMNSFIAFDLEELGDMD